MSRFQLAWALGRDGDRLLIFNEDAWRFLEGVAAVYGIDTETMVIEAIAKLCRGRARWEPPSQPDAQLH